MSDPGGSSLNLMRFSYRLLLIGCVSACAPMLPEPQVNLPTPQPQPQAGAPVTTPPPASLTTASVPEGTSASEKDSDICEGAL